MIAVVLALLLFVAPGALAADSGSVSSGSSSSGSDQAAPAPEPAKTAEELVSSTLAQDIATASYYELAAWCLQVGLDDAGSRTDLQTRLASHFGVTLPTPPAAQGKTVTIRSAREAAYTTDDASKEKYLTLRGDVVLEVKDDQAGTLQVIQAASLTYNQTKRTVSALGNVTYTLTHGDQTDTFTGASLAFNLDTSEAVFYDGSNTRVVNRAGAGVPYTFKGKTITRLSNDTVIMKDGSFTTSPTPDDPLYHIQMSTAWLLAPSEWAAQGALLMVGRVPIIYLPGFFWPGEEFLFNPNVGYQARGGSFVQTTTYLLGRKPAQNAPFSFLQLSSAGSAGYDLETHGLFLRKVPSQSSAPPDTRTLKVMLDAYSRLGFFAGIAGDFTPVGTFRTGIALSRSIFTDPTGYYTPYLPVAVPGYTVGQDIWNTSNFVGLDVPFRFGLDGTFKTVGDVFSLTGTLQLYSDPVFTSDFYSRSEAGILASLAPTTAATAQTPAATQPSLTWDVNGSLDFSRLVNSPLARTVSVPTIEARMAWISYTPDPSTLSVVQLADPGTSFYFPTSITAPAVNISIAGDLLTLPGPVTPQGPKTGVAPAAQSSTPPGSSASSVPSTAEPSAQQPPVAQPPAAGAAQRADPGKGVRFAQGPGSPSKPASPEPAARVPFRAPVPQPDLPPGPLRGLSTLSVSYQIQPRATLEHTFDTGGWTTRNSVDYGLRYQTLDSGGTSSVTAAASILDHAADISLGLAADVLWRDRFNPSATEVASTDWQPLLQHDLEQDHLTLSSTLQASIRPLAAIPALSASTLQYQLGVRLYQLGYQEGSGTSSPVFLAPPLNWDTSTIVSHSVASTLSFVAPWSTDTVAVTAQLPPLIPTLTGTVNVGAGPIKGRLQGGYSEPTTGPLYQPLVAGLTADFGGGITAGEEVQYDLQAGNWQRSTSSVQLGPVSGSFIAQWMVPVDGLGTAVAGGREGVLPYSVKLGYENDGQPHWYWKNRIKASLSLKTHWSLNLQQYTDNLFDFSLALTLNIYKALDLTFSSYSTNSKTYRYIPGWPEAVGEVWVNPLSDLASSFAFWDTPARQQSGFKIKTLAVTATQHFPDWDLSFQYQGSPQLRVDPVDGKQKFLWTPTFAITAQWDAVPELNSNIKGDYTGVTFR
jgi:hypothetical protein